MKQQASSASTVEGMLDGDIGLSGDEPLNRLLAGLPGPMGRALAALLRPSAIWIRIPLGIVLIFAGLFGFLPILGFWMIPVGALLLSEDIPVLRRPTMRALAVFQRWWDRARERMARRRDHP